MAKKIKLTTEEIVLSAATDVTSLMEPRLSEYDEEEFVKLFIQKTFEMLETQANIFIGIGLEPKTSDKYFSEDMKVIIKFVEGNTKKKYSFRYGRLLMFFGKEFGTAIWEK